MAAILTIAPMVLDQLFIYQSTAPVPALLSFGDRHASHRATEKLVDPELKLGGHVLLTCRILKQKDVYPLNGSNPTTFPLKLEYPLTETDGHTPIGLCMAW
jgi:hypothetical protein